MTGFQNIDDQLLPHIGETWRQFDFFFRIEGQRSAFFCDVYYEGDDQRHDLSPMTGLQNLSLVEAVQALQAENTRISNAVFTHFQMTITADGRFNANMGYGPVKWDPPGRNWPDDITSEPYTYPEDGG